VLNVIFVTALSILVPICCYFGGVSIMHRYAAYRSAMSHPDQALAPLNGRFWGYTQNQAMEYWSSIQDSHAYEIALLEIDLFFPFVLGAGIAIGVYLACRVAGFEISPLLLFAPAILYMLSDWTENSILLAQLDNFIKDPASVSKIAMEIASWATQIKLFSIVVATITILALAVWNTLIRPFLS